MDKMKPGSRESIAAWSAKADEALKASVKEEFLTRVFPGGDSDLYTGDAPTTVVRAGMRGVPQQPARARSFDATAPPQLRTAYIRPTRTPVGTAAHTQGNERITYLPVEKRAPDKSPWQQTFEIAKIAGKELLRIVGIKL